MNLLSVVERVVCTDVIRVRQNIGGGSNVSLMVKWS